MSDSGELGALLAQARQEQAYLRRRIDRLEKRLLRQEKIDEMTRYQAKRANSQLEQAKRLAEQANEAKTEFLATMSHEIRTPLNILLGMGELLAGTRLDETQSQYLQSLRMSGNHLLKIINNILEFSRIESGAVELEQAPFDLRALIGDVEAMGVHLSGEKNIAFSLAFDPALPLRRVGDLAKIKQVLLNLIGNAVKFTDTGGVTLRVQAAGKRGGEQVLFEIADTGIGIPEHRQEIIFERFSRIDQGIVKERGGVGLGLAIVQRLVSAMGGQLSFSSEVERGTSFVVLLPLPLGTDSSTDLPSDVVVRMSGLQGPRLRILAVDDVSLNIDIVRNFMTDLSVDLICADNGMTAFDIYRTRDLDLILLDIRMPVMDGFACVKKIRAMERTLEREPIPVVAMTAHAFREERASILAAGFDDVVSKPFSRDELLGAVWRQIGRRVEQPAPSGRHDQPPSRQRAPLDTVPRALARMMPRVLAKISKDLDLVRTALQAGDCSTIADTGHALKGVAGFYGCTGLSDWFDTLEEAAMAGDIETVRTVLAGLDLRVERLRAGQAADIDAAAG